MNRVDRLAGALLGQCLGDALGFPVEGQPPAFCAAYVAHLRAGRRLGRRPFEFGQYTDDSQLARELLESWVACEGFDPADYARRIAAIFDEARIVGRGQATEQAAGRLHRGVPWDEAGAPPPAAGNGSAMRAGPIGLLATSDEQIISIAVDQGRITHQDPRCAAGAAAIALGVSRAARGDAVSTLAFVDTIADAISPLHPGFAAAVRRLTEWVGEPPAVAVGEIARAGLAPDYRDGWRGISPFVMGSVLWALYAYLRTPDEPWSVYWTAIAVGGDVDTTAAMAGALVGARVGLSGLPAAAREVNDQGQWGYDALVDLCRRALA